MQSLQKGASELPSDTQQAKPGPTHCAKSQVPTRLESTGTRQRVVRKNSILKRIRVEKSIRT